jgi:predicted dehydrogenase
MKMLHRRQFINGMAASALSAVQWKQSVAAERKLKMGLIGCGWYGMVDLKAAFKVGGVEAVALCDVDSQHLNQSADEVEKLQGNRPKVYKDYRELLESPGLDFVLIATPPHWHALPFIAACQKKLDIYCEKPLAYDIREGQSMVQAARLSGRVVQIGFQRRQSLAVREAAQYIESGGAGRIVQVEAQIHYKAKVPDTTPQTPPPSLDWDLWCGPAPKLPYAPSIGHFAWRLEAAYGNGHLVDWGIHWVDSIRVMLKERMPRSVQASGGIYVLKNKITTPDTLTVSFDFETCPVVWRHRIWGAAEYTPDVQNGVMFFGEKETVFVNDNRWVIIPAAEGSTRKVNEPHDGGESGTRHMEEFLMSVRTRQQPGCPPEDAFQSTATVQLAMIAYNSQSIVKWDNRTQSVSENSSAARLLKREYRAPWQHPNQS